MLLVKTGVRTFCDTYSLRTTELTHFVAKPRKPSIYKRKLIVSYIQLFHIVSEILLGLTWF